MRLKQKLQDVLPKEQLGHVSNRIHVIGDVAILSIPAEADGYKEEIAEAVISQKKNIRIVLNKISKLEGDRRVAAFEVLSGTGGTITNHKEYGFNYRLDVTQVFFSSHLSYEHQRVASQVRPSEWVLVPFAGVGPFVVPIAARGAKVMALEKSSNACRWLAENLRANGVEERAAILNADAFYILQMINRTFDRAVVPTPYGMDKILEIIADAVRMGGVVHFYTFKKRQQIEGLSKKYMDMGLEVRLCRRCGNVAPGVSRWAFDLVKC
ncbi:MAG: RsmD family RNA methyltransferase [Methanothrix sp.]|nr:RsmD family RNA methyltransferase [Methanothrix sp.]